MRLIQRRKVTSVKGGLQHIGMLSKLNTDEKPNRKEKWTHRSVIFRPFSGRVVLKLPNIEKDFHYWLRRNRVAHKKIVSYQDKDYLIVQGSIANLRYIVIMPKTLITSCQVDRSSKNGPMWELLCTDACKKRVVNSVRFSSYSRQLPWSLCICNLQKFWTTFERFKMAIKWIAKKKEVPYLNSDF